MATEDEETALVARYVFTLAFLGITPLIVFLVIYYCCPDLLRLLDASAK
jgi:hypothetical protein